MEINAADYGLAPGSGVDCAFAAFKSVLACKGVKNPVLKIPKGTYHMYPDKAFEKLYCISNHGIYELKKIAFPLIEFDGLTIDGQGADFVFHGKIIPFVLDRCSNITLKNLTISWELPMHIQAQVLKTGDGFIDVEILEENSYKIENKKLILRDETWEERPLDYSLVEMDVNTKAPAYDGGDRSLGISINELDVTETGPNKLRIEGAIGRYPAVGNMLIIRAGMRHAPAVFVCDSKDITVDGLEIYSAIGMGVIAQLSENITVKNTNMTFQPNSRRLFTLNADGVQFVNCKGLVTVENCLIEGQLDDGLNLHGIYAQIQEKTSPTSILVKLVHDEQKGVKIAHPGDEMRIVKYTNLQPYWTGIIKDVRQISIDYMEFEFEQEVPEVIGEKDVIENLTWNPDLIVRNCTFRNNRVRALLLATRGKVLVEGNTFGVSGSVIHCAAETTYWFESTPAQDITIRNNVFDNCCYVPSWGRYNINMGARPESYQEPCIMRNVVIDSNVFKCYDKGLLHIQCTDGVRFTNNTVILTDAYPRHNLVEAAFNFTNCKNVEISGNDMPDEFKTVRSAYCDREVEIQ